MQPLTRYNDTYRSTQATRVQDNVNNTISELEDRIALLTKTLTAVCHLVEESQIGEDSYFYKNEVNEFLYEYPHPRSSDDSSTN